LFQNNKCITSNEKGKVVTKAILESDLNILQIHGIAKRALEQ
jgi:hypothetical protein